MEESVDTKYAILMIILSQRNITPDCKQVRMQKYNFEKGIEESKDQIRKEGSRLRIRELPKTVRDL